MMKKWIVLFLTLFFCSSVLGTDRRDELLQVINQELDEVVRLNRQMGNKRPDLLLRIAELYLEKARIVKDKENEQFLMLPSEERQKINKSKYFADSKKLFLNAQATCNIILKKFKNFSGKSDVYYILAYNAKEFQDPARAKKYFNLAVKTSSPRSITNVKSKMALAEIYFVNGQFREAIALYEKPLQKKSDKWWTKDAYNLAWCYYRTGQYKKAIAKMQEVHQHSKDPRFVDMSSSVERDLAYFYAEAGEIGQAVAFFQGRNENVAQNLTAMGKHLISKGKITAAELVLNEALKHEDGESEIIEINLLLLKLYERFAHYSKHLRVSKTVAQLHAKKSLNDEQMEQFTFQIKKVSALLQRQVVNKAYKNQPKRRAAQMKLISDYFVILAQLEDKKAYQVHFHLAETYYASGRYQDAIEYYSLVLDEAKAAGDKKVEDLALNGLMAGLGQKGVSQAVKDKHLAKAYTAYLTRYPNSKQAFHIYQRLFSSYYEQKEIRKCEEILIVFKNNFPKAQKTQEAMLARVMDYYKGINNNEEIRNWVGRINKGEFVVSKRYADKLRQLLLYMQFSKVEQANKNGDKKSALKGYIQIYLAEDSSAVAKKQAAYNVAVLFYELGDIKRSELWAKRAIGLMDVNDVREFEKEFMYIASELFNRRLFVESAAFYHLLLNKLCTTKSKNKNTLLKNANVIYLASNDFDNALAAIEQGEKCGISASVMTSAKLELLEALGSNKKWHTFTSLHGQLEKDQRLWPELIHLSYPLYKAYSDSGRHKYSAVMKNKLEKYYDYCKKKKMDIPLEGLDIIADFKLSELEKEIQRLQQIELKFPENVYNYALKQKFQQLDLVTNHALAILQTGSGQGIVKTYQYLVKAYQGVAVDVAAFTPPGKSAEYVSSFKQSMNKLAEPIRKKADDFLREGQKQITKHNILSSDNYWFLTQSRFPVKVEYRYLPGSVIMDRGGRQ